MKVMDEIYKQLDRMYHFGVQFRAETTKLFNLLKEKSEKNPKALLDTKLIVGIMNSGTLIERDAIDLKALYHEYATIGVQLHGSSFLKDIVTSKAPNPDMCYCDECFQKDQKTLDEVKKIIENTLNSQKDSEEE